MMFHIYPRPTALYARTMRSMAIIISSPLRKNLSSGFLPPVRAKGHWESQRNSAMPATVMPLSRNDTVLDLLVRRFFPQLHQSALSRGNGPAFAGRGRYRIGATGKACRGRRRQARRNYQRTNRRKFSACQLRSVARRQSRDPRRRRRVRQSSRSARFIRARAGCNGRQSHAFRSCRIQPFRRFLSHQLGADRSDHGRHAKNRST